MKGKLVGVLALLGASLTMQAETVSQKQASRIAETFFNASYGEVMAKPKFVWNGRQLTTDRLFAPFYIYNHPKGGFVIIAADTKAYPVLAYSRAGKFERETLTEEESELLSKYAHEVELVRYDSASPDRAIAAWRDLPNYIGNILRNPYSTPEFNRLDSESKELLESMDRRNAAVFLPAAVEFDYPVSNLFRPATLDEVTASQDIDADVPFKFYEDFIAQVESEQKARQASLEEIISPTKPVVYYSGGAHFTVRFPDRVAMSTLYSLDGMKVMERTYSDSDRINLDLSSLPAGFYVLMTLSEGGNVYGLKLYR